MPEDLIGKVGGGGGEEEELLANLPALLSQAEIPYMQNLSH
jgi:hypothetical protein